MRREKDRVMVAVGDEVRYAAIAGDEWDARVVRVHSGVVIDVEIAAGVGAPVTVAGVPKMFRRGQRRAWREHEGKK